MTATEQATTLASTMSEVRFAFYGRVSSDDLQSPEDSRAWQIDSARQLIAGHGEIVTEFFDISESRSIPWSRRPEASALLLAMRAAGREFDAVVIGEPQRAFSGHQFALVFPLFIEFGVEMWVPELGGAIDPTSDVDEMLMNLFGGLSKSERQRIKIRVKKSMEAMARRGDRFLGGRPPYGYELVDIGPHPNPTKAADGKRLKRLGIDPVASPIVGEIFNLRLEGRGYHAIAKVLNERGVPSPSAHDPARNRHRQQGPWSHSTVKTILTNPRYTGHGVWGKAPKQERLIDVDDVAAGYKTVQKLVDPSEWIWTETQVHPAIVDLETFERAQKVTGTKKSGRPRKPRASHRPYLLSGILFCADCGCRMEGDERNGRVRYRCRFGRRFPGAAHCETIDVWEEVLVPQLDEWLGAIFQPESIERDLDRIIAALEEPDETHAATLAALRDEERRAQSQVENLRRAIADGADSEAIIPALNDAQARVKAAQNRRATLAPPAPKVTREQILEALGGTLEVASILELATPEERAALYRSCGVNVHVDHTRKEANTKADLGKPGVGLSRVGGGT